MKVPQTLIQGEDALVKFPVPDLPDEFASDRPSYSLSFVNLDDSSVDRFEGSVSDGTVTFLFGTDEMTPGAYAWRLNYQGDNDPVFDDTDVFNGNYVQPAGTPYTFETIGDVDIPENDPWVFDLPGVETATLITTDRIRALTPGTAGTFYNATGGWNRAFIQVGVDGDGRRHGVGRTSDNKLLYYTSFPGTYAVRIRKHVAAPSIIRRVVATGYTAVVDDVTRDVHARTMVKLLEKIIEDRVTNRADVVSYSIGGRSLAREPLENLYSMLNKYRWEYDRITRGGKLRRVNFKDGRDPGPGYNRGAFK